MVCERWWVTKMVCDKVVCERGCVKDDKVGCTRWCVKDGVLQRWCEKEGVSKMVCERWCLTK